MGSFWALLSVIVTKSPTPHDQKFSRAKSESHRELKEQFASSAWSPSPQTLRPSSNWSMIWLQHLHKAGGTTFCALLSQNEIVRAVFKKDCLLAGRSLDQRSRQSLDEVERILQERKYNAIASEDGVFPSYVNPSVATAHGWRFVTVLRHPLNRILSHCYHHRVIRRPNSSSTARLSNSSQQSIIKFARKQTFYGSNYATRVFSSKIDDCTNPCRSWFCACKKGVTESDFVAAKHILDQFAVVLITTWFEESAPLLTHSLGLKVEDARPRNVAFAHKRSSDFGNRVFHPSEGVSINGTNDLTNARKRLDPVAYRRLSRLNSFDLKLFKYAAELCRDRVAEYLGVKLDMAALGDIDLY